MIFRTRTFWCKLGFSLIGFLLFGNLLLLRQIINGQNEKKDVYVTNSAQIQMFLGQESFERFIIPPLLKKMFTQQTDIKTASMSIDTNALPLIEEYQSIPEIQYLKQTASNKTSFWELATNQTIYQLGERIMINITLYDGWGRRLLTGGDSLKIWAVNPLLNANSSGFIIDNGDGSYTGVLQALWSGSVEIRLSIATTKEHITIFLNRVLKFGVSIPMEAVFFKNIFGQILKEKAICSTIPYIPGFDDLCNFTQANFNISFYCGKPRSKVLSCEDWKNYNTGPVIAFNEKELYFMRNYKHMHFTKTIKVTVKGGTKRLAGDKINCHERPMKETWFETVPTGYFYNKRWYSLGCINQLKRNKNVYLNCMKNRTFLFVGDSTIRHWFAHLTEFLNLNITVGRWDLIKDNAWQTYSHAERKDLNISLAWAPHELPFYGSLNSSRFNIRSVGSRLDEIPRGSNAVVLLHWYSHLARVWHGNYREHIQNAKRAILDLLARAPQVRILIKGPHSIQYHSNFEPHDFVKRYQQQILFEEFSDVQDKMIYLDEWDMTVATENINVHPPRAVNFEMIHHFMSYICS